MLFIFQDTWRICMLLLLTSLATMEGTAMNKQQQEIILIAQLSKAFGVPMKRIIKDFNSGNIFVWDLKSLKETWYEDLKDVLDGTIDEEIEKDIKKGDLVKIQDLYFMYT